MNQEKNIKFTKIISAFLIKKYYATVLFRVLKPTEYSKIKRPHVHINVSIFATHITSTYGNQSQVVYKMLL